MSNFKNQYYKMLEERWIGYNQRTKLWSDNTEVIPPFSGQWTQTMGFLPSSICANSTRPSLEKQIRNWILSSRNGEGWAHALVAPFPDWVGTSVFIGCSGERLNPVRQAQFCCTGSFLHVAHFAHSAPLPSWFLHLALWFLHSAAGSLPRPSLFCGRESFSVPVRRNSLGIETC